MRKEYQKPMVEMVSLITEEKITSDSDAALTSGDVVDGEMGLESSIF